MAAQQNEGEFSRQDYLTPGKPIAFGGRSLVYRYARPSFKNMTQVASKLSEIDTYTRHRAFDILRSYPTSCHIGFIIYHSLE